MLYNIYINQKYLSENSPELDLKDGAILTYLKELCIDQHPSIERERHEGYTWVNYEWLMQEMPLLKISSRGALTPRIKRIETAGYIIIKQRYVNGKTRIYIKMTAKGTGIFLSRGDENVDLPFTKMNDTVHTNEQTTPTPFTKMNDTVHETEPNYNHNNNKHNTREHTFPTTKKEKKDNKPILTVFNIFSQLNPVGHKLWYRNTTQRNAAQEILTMFELDDIKKRVQFILDNRDELYFPSISSPWDFLNKYEKVRSWIANRKKDNLQ